MKNFEITDAAQELHQCILSDEINEARSFIRNFSPDKRRRIIRKNDFYFIPPALIVAIEKSNIDFVKFLIDECGAEFDEMYPGAKDLRYYNYAYCRIQRWVSPFEVAILRNETHIVEYLINIGADVDRLAKETVSIACKAISLKTVQLLVAHGADVNALDERGNSCLMNAAGNVDLCRFLLDKGADINKRSNRGNTALHAAAKSKCISTVKLLVARGADASYKNWKKLDPLHVASLKGAVEVVYFLIDAVFKDVNRHIEALQVLGKTFACCGRISEALSAWGKAIQLSSESGIIICAATLSTPFGIAVEATQVAELDILAVDEEKRCMQCIVIINKIFGPEHREFFRAINEFLWRYVNECRDFDRYLRLLAYNFQMLLNSNADFESIYSGKSINLNHLHVCVTSLRSPNVKPTLDFDAVYDFMSAVAQHSTKCCGIKVTEKIMDLIICATLMFGFVDCDKSQNMNFQRLVSYVIKRGLKSSRGETLLMLAVQLYANLYMDLILPPPGVIAMLIECGADVNERDNNGNNVFHIMMQSSYKHEDSVKALGVTFVNSGIHLDARNHRGIRAISYCRKLRLGFKPSINLMCSAARVIRRLNITVKGTLPKILFDFVEMH